METKHTPGPWEFTDNALVGPKIDDKPIWLRPVILRSEVGVSDANARLIAAAPELLEALRGMMDAYMDLCDENEPNYRSYEFRQSKWEAARAAIAKATGGNNG